MTPPPPRERQGVGNNKGGGGLPTGPKAPKQRRTPSSSWFQGQVVKIRRCIAEPSHCMDTGVRGGGGGTNGSGRTRTGPAVALPARHYSPQADVHAGRQRARVTSCAHAWRVTSYAHMG